MKFNIKEATIEKAVLKAKEYYEPIIKELKQHDVRQYIPEGKYCGDCKFNDNESCIVCEGKLLWKYWGYHPQNKLLKHHSCPKPYKEK